MTEYYTEDLSKFGARERDMLGDILKQPLPDTFSGSGVKPAMNMGSGYVFLVNDDYQVAMMNGDTLEVFHTTPYDGHEGFITDLLDEYTPDDLNGEDARYIYDCAVDENVKLPEIWEKYGEGE